jgi:hypothetical protein
MTTENPMISLQINLPDGYRLSSVQAFYTGEWYVCLCTVKPGEWIGLDYGIGYDMDVEQAAIKAMAKCEANRERRLRGETIDGRVARFGSMAAPTQTTTKSAEELGL